MTDNRMIAHFTKGGGWAYNIGDRIALGPKSTRQLLVAVYNLSFHEAGEKMAAARNSRSPVSLPEPRRPAREGVSA